MITKIKVWMILLMFKLYNNTDFKFQNNLKTYNFIIVTMSKLNLFHTWFNILL